MTHPWIADRMGTFDSSGIRKVFDLAAKLENPVNLSIGQPDFDVPEPIQEAAIAAIRGGRNGYALTQGMPTLREKLMAGVKQEFGHSDRELLVTSGTSGALVLALMALVNPGDEVVCFDPFFVMYPALINVIGGKCVTVDTYPDFKVDVTKLEAALTPRTKVILLNSPANPTGALASDDEVKALAELAAKRNIALISDEIYRQFQYEGQFVSPAKYNPDVLVIDGCSKTYGMTGWRVGWAHGPAAIVREMIKLQQWASAAALDYDMSSHIADYRRKRDLLVNGLRNHYQLTTPGGAFYAFPQAPWGTGSQFVAKAIENKLLIIPGNIFSHRDTHFRISYAASDDTIQRGVEILQRLAQNAP